MNGKNLVVLFFLILVSLNGLDVITTLIGLQIGFTEGNWIMVDLMNIFGVVEALLLKFFVVLLTGTVAVTGFMRSHMNPALFLTPFLVGIVFMSYIVFWNCVQLWSLWL